MGTGAPSPLHSTLPDQPDLAVPLRHLAWIHYLHAQTVRSASGLTRISDVTRALRTAVGALRHPVLIAPAMVGSTATVALPLLQAARLRLLAATLVARVPVSAHDPASQSQVRAAPRYTKHRWQKSRAWPGSLFFNLANHFRRPSSSASLRSKPMVNPSCEVRQDPRRAGGTAPARLTA